KGLFVQISSRLLGGGGGGTFRGGGGGTALCRRLAGEAGGNADLKGPLSLAGGAGALRGRSVELSAGFGGGGGPAISFFFALALITVPANKEITISIFFLIK